MIVLFDEANGFMAKVIPEGWRELAAAGAAQRELATLAQLAAGLPDDYTVYHGVHWTRFEQGDAWLGEIDFAIVSPAGKLLLVEQKSGLLDETAEGLVKVYSTKERRVAHELGRTRSELARRLQRFCPQARFVIDALFYCPDYTVRQPESAGIDARRIVDAGQRDALLPIIRSILPAGDPPIAQRAALHRFLADQLRLVPEVNALVGQAQTLYTRLSGGLAQWARQIECEPFRLRVIGSAGSGKTQLALAVLRDALAAGRRPLYVCYNRPLADHVALIAPAGAEVATYHQLADRISRATGCPHDFTQAGVFSRLESFLDGFAGDERWLFDELIIDEGQDFVARWKDNLLGLLRAPGRAWWLEDPLQNLYARPQVALPGWVTVRSQTNYRSPREPLELLNGLLSGRQTVDAGSPLGGSPVDIASYADGDELLAQSTRAITQCIAAGYKREMIAIVTFRGRENSLLAGRDRLGAYPLRRFTGDYDLLGNPLFSAGDVLVDSVYRFKGQSAPCVIFSEIDFADSGGLDEQTLRKLLVGITRATMKLVLIASRRSAALLRTRCG